MFNDPELIPLLSHAFMPAKSAWYTEPESGPSTPDIQSDGHAPQFFTAESGSVKSATTTTPRVSSSASHDTTSAQYPTNQHSDVYEAEVCREMERRSSTDRMIHIHIGEQSQSQVQGGGMAMSEQEELKRRLEWAQQMILTNPVFCAKSCQ